MRYNIFKQGDPNGKHSFGLISRTLPTLRDYTPNTPVVQSDLQKINAQLTETPKNLESTATMPNKHDSNAKYLTTTKNQTNLGSCVTFGTFAVAEGILKKLTNKNFDLSELYGYYEMRHTIFDISGDTGGWLRAGMEALVRSGAPPSFTWPYVTNRFEEPPPRRADKYADDFMLKDGKYFRLDSYPYIKPEPIIERMKLYLTKGFLLSTGFDCYDSLRDSSVDRSGDIPFPSGSEGVIGGHAVCIYGYDNEKQITNPYSSQATKGAFLIKNSWGTGWGNGGLGAIPYEYYLQNLANDTWTILSASIVDSGMFG